MNKPLLLLFLREPVKGKVKTRLAAGLGDTEALAIYTRLLTHTMRESASLDVHKQAWYADAPVVNDVASSFGFEQRHQRGNDLGERMNNAFDKGFAEGYSPVIIIGSDLPGMHAQLLSEAFTALHTHDTVLGPTVDGGYYLLGLNAPLPALFQHKQWSTSTVFSDSASDLVMHGRTCHLLPILRDVDTVEDLAHVQLP